MKRIIELEIGEIIQIETGYTNWNRADNDFTCVLAGYDEKGRVILDAENSVCFDGRNSIQPYFIVEKDTCVSLTVGRASYKIPGCFVLRHIIGMDGKGRFLLKTRTKAKSYTTGSMTEDETADTIRMGIIH